ncbi:MAG: N-acetyltransferase [Cyanobacteria bacterium P01_A01_bin.83]
MHVRIATSRDCDDIREIHLCAFAKDEREIVSKLSINLLFEETTPPIISLVAETGGAVVGHVAFSPVVIDNNEDLQGYILAPLGVKPDYQNRGIGSKLVDSGIQRLLNVGVNILFVYGDPKYYSRFGFSADTAALYIPPYKLQYSHGWQAIILNEYQNIKSPLKIACVASLCHSELW